MDQTLISKHRSMVCLLASFYKFLIKFLMMPGFIVILNKLKLQKDVTCVDALMCICFLAVGDGEVEVIVVVVCLSFLFLTVFIIMLCLRKREV